MSSVNLNVTKPVPASRVVDVLADPMCLSIQCTDLRTVMDALVAKVCNSDLPSLDFKCLTPVTTVEELYQLLIDEVCTVQEVVIPVEDAYELCSLETFVCNPACLVVTNPCGDTTEHDVIQALISRSNTLLNELCALKDRVAALESANISLINKIAGLQNCCD